MVGLIKKVQSAVPPFAVSPLMSRSIVSATLTASEYTNPSLTEANRLSDGGKDDVTAVMLISPTMGRSLSEAAPGNSPPPETHILPTFSPTHESTAMTVEP